MLMVRSISIRHLVLSGLHKDRICRPVEKAGNGSVKVVFVDCDQDEFGIVEENQLEMMEIPGWPETRTDLTYGFMEHKRQWGSGTNMLRITNIAQPRALKYGDRLATGSTVTGRPRMGYNGSALICLDGIGWVELASRLPIALAGKKKFKLPGDLMKGNKLATGCLVSRKSVSTGANWTDIFLERDCRIDVPSCIPLALA
jgi:hypothetical protein